MWIAIFAQALALFTLLLELQHGPDCTDFNCLWPIYLSLTIIPSTLISKSAREFNLPLSPRTYLILFVWMWAIAMLLLSASTLTAQSPLTDRALWAGIMIAITLFSEFWFETIPLLLKLLFF